MHNTNPSDTILEPVSFEMMFEQNLIRLIETFNKMDKNGRDERIKRIISENPLIYHALNELLDNLTSEEHHGNTCPYKFKWEYGQNQFIFKETVSYGTNQAPQLNNEFNQFSPDNNFYDDLNDN